MGSGYSSGYSSGVSGKWEAGEGRSGRTVVEEEVEYLPERHEMLQDERNQAVLVAFVCRPAVVVARSIL